MSRITVVKASFFADASAREITEFFPDASLIIEAGKYMFGVPQEFMTKGKSFNTFVKSLNDSTFTKDPIHTVQYLGRKADPDAGIDRTWPAYVKGRILDMAEDRTQCANALYF